MTPMWSLRWLLVAASIVSVSMGAAESPPGIQWQKAFGGTNDEWLYIAQPLSDGGFILGGTSDSPASGNKSSPAYGGADFWVIKVDANGGKLREGSFGGSANDQLTSIVETSDHGLILGGFSSSPVSGNKLSPNYGDNDYWVIKLDAVGQKVWEKSFGGTGDDELYSVLQLADGGYLLS